MDSRSDRPRARLSYTSCGWITGMPWMPICKVIRPRAAISGSPRYGRTPAPGTLSSAGYLPGARGMQRMPYSRLVPAVSPTFCRLTCEQSTSAVP